MSLASSHKVSAFIGSLLRNYLGKWGPCLLPIGLIAISPAALCSSGQQGIAWNLPTEVQSAADLRKSGIDAFGRGDIVEARHDFEKLVRRNPTGENYAYLATAEFHAGDYAGSIEHFEKAIHLGYVTSAVHFNLGLAYLKLHQPRPGIEHLRSAAQQDPSSADTQYALGVALLNANEARDALPHLRAASSRMPHDPAVTCNLVRAEFAAGESSSALQHIDQLTSDPLPSAALVATLAEICLNNQQAQKARSLLENAGELEPQNNELKLLLAKASLAAGEPIEAQAALKGLPCNTGKPGETEYLEAQAMALQDHLPEAELHIAGALQADPDNVDFLITQAWVEELKGKYQAAVTTLKAASRLDPGRADVLYRMGVNDFLLMRYPEAAEQCKLAIQKSPQYAAAYFVLGMSLLDHREFPAAESALRRAVELNGRLPLPYYQLGIVLLKTGHAGDSLKAFDQALSLNRRLPPAYFWRAEARNQQGDRSGAIADLETAVALEPDYADAYYKLGKFYREAGQQEKAQEAFRRNAELQSRRADEDRKLMERNLIPLK